jgi:hypothetical protein
MAEREKEVSVSRERALHIACEGGHAEVVFVLLSGGAVVDTRDQVSSVRDDDDLQDRSE